MLARTYLLCEVYFCTIAFSPYLVLNSVFASHRIIIVFSVRNFSNSYAAACFEPISEELHQTGTFWTLYRLSYSAAPCFKYSLVRNSFLSWYCPSKKALLKLLCCWRPQDIGLDKISARTIWPRQTNGRARNMVSAFSAKVLLASSWSSSE